VDNPSPRRPTELVRICTDCGNRENIYSKEQINMRKECREKLAANSAECDDCRQFRSNFTFHPVGQGLFYSGEILGQFRFVYDCGTSDHKERLKEEISGLKNGFVDTDNEGLDFVMISHLHEDHMCGLDQLYKEYTVKKLLLPYLDYEKGQQAITLLLYFAIFGEEYPWDSKGNLREGMDDKLAVFNALFGAYKDRAESHDDFTSIPITIKDKSTDVYFLENQQGDLNRILCKCICRYWAFRYFNRTIQDESLFAFYKMVDEKLGGDFLKLFISSLNDKQNKTTKSKNKVFNAALDFYKKNVRAKENIASTIFIHYPEAAICSVKDHTESYCAVKARFDTKKFGHFLRCFSEWQLENIISEPLVKKYAQNYEFAEEFLLGNALGQNAKVLLAKRSFGNDMQIVTILTGDAEFDDEMHKTLQSIIKGTKYPKRKIICQLPHHGSFENYEKFSASLKFADILILPYGVGNRFWKSQNGMPYLHIFTEAEEKCKKIYSVTQFTEYTCGVIINCNSNPEIFLRESL
jgi:hypothetical protein